MAGIVFYLIHKYIHTVRTHKETAVNHRSRHPLALKGFPRLSLSPERLHRGSRLPSPLQGALVDGRYLAPLAGLGSSHVDPRYPNLGPVVLGPSSPPAHHDATAPPQAKEVRQTTNQDERNKVV